MNIIQKIVYRHLSVINKYPKGISNRFQNNADKWVQSLNHPHIKTYHQFFLNQQTNKYQIKLFQTQKQQQHWRQISQKDRTGIYRMYQLLNVFSPHRVDDHLPSIDTKDMTLVKFLKEAIQQRKQHHKYPFYVLLLITLNLILYYIFWYGQNFGQYQRVVVANAQVLQFYRFQDQQKLLRQIKERIGMVNDQYMKQLQVANISPK